MPKTHSYALERLTGRSYLQTPQYLTENQTDCMNPTLPHVQNFNLEYTVISDSLLISSGILSKPHGQATLEVPRRLCECTEYYLPT